MEVLNHSLWLVLSYQSLGFFIYTLYLYLQHKDTGRLIFSFFLLSFSFSSFFIHTQLFDHASGFFLYYPLAFCFGLTLVPLFYLHFKSLLTKDFEIRSRDILHFIPSISMVVFLMPFWVLITINLPHYLNSVYGIFLMKGIPGQPTWMLEILVKSTVALQLLGYSIKAVQVYRNHRRQLHAPPCKELRDYYSGIKTFAAGFAAMMVLLIFHRFIHMSGGSLSSTLFVITLLIINIGLAFYGIHFDDNYLYNCQQSPGLTSILQNPDQPDQPKVDDPCEKDGKYQSSCMCKSLKDELVKKLLALMSEDEPFTDSKLKLEDVADMLGTNTKYLSQLINEHFEKNFHAFLNDYRCAKVIKLFRDPNYSNYSIEGIAETCGFNSRSTFVASFKRYSGKLPSAYRNSMRKTLKKKS
ncbi:MAG: helix-turn-helix transcriptional regulator [Lentimicrobiaceae bacterium]|nr:helix-turn-helix transcriptional regulator [Lentimicrobiaceae bacterium]